MTTPIRILLVEDSPDDELLFRRALVKEEFEPDIRRVEDAKQMRGALRDGRWDVVLADYYLPRCSALEVLGLLRDQRTDIPCIVVSGKIGEEKAAEVMRAGAADYISKDRLARLAPAIRRELVDAENRRRQRETEKTLARTQREMERRRIREQEIRLMSQLVSGVAHEVRNPLNSISSLIEALFMELNLGGEYTEYRLHIQQQVDRLSKLMQDLLAVGRPIDRRGLGIIDVRPLCRETVEGWNIEHEELGPRAKLEDVTSADTPLTVVGDYERLRSAVLNLLDNGAAHSPAQSTLTVRLSLADNRRVRIEVIDRGSGIPEEHLSRLFEPFFSLRRGGTGLGLNIVRTVVEALGGSIEVRNNEPEPGATSEIRLPLTDEREGKMHGKGDR